MNFYNLFNYLFILNVFNTIDNFSSISLRFIGNLIISYELYQKGESNLSDMKILEIGNWLEKLDKGTDKFYMSISIALKHIKMANFIHKLYIENEIGGCKLVNIYFYSNKIKKLINVKIS